MTAMLWLVPALLLSGSEPVSVGGKACVKTCESRHVPCTDAPVEAQLMCLQVERRCVIRCDAPSPALKAKAAKAKAKGRRAESKRRPEQHRRAGASRAR